MCTKLSSSALAKVQVDQSYVLDYISSAILYLSRNFFPRLAADEDECMVARKYIDCALEKMKFLDDELEKIAGN